MFKTKYMTTEQPQTVNNSLEVVKAKYHLAVTGYQQVLQAAENITFSKDSLDQDYKPLKELRELLGKIEATRKARKAPHVEAGKLEDNAAKSLSEPLEDILSKKTAEYTKLANEIKADKEREEREVLRKKAITDTMSAFILTYSQKVANSTSIQELNDIERLINLETGQKHRYQEYLPEFKASCEPIRSLLSAQKEKVRSLATLEKEGLELAKNGQDREAIELLEQKEQLEADIELNKTLIQEEAIKSVSSQMPSSYEVVLPNAPKARRTQWEIELVDWEAAVDTGLVNVTLNTAAAKIRMKELRESNFYKDKKDFTVNGIRYYEKSIY